MSVVTGLPVRHTYSILIQGKDTVLPVQVITVPTVVLRWYSNLPSGRTDPVVLSGDNS